MKVNRKIKHPIYKFNKKISKDVEDIAGAWSDHFDVSIKNESTRAKVVLSVCYLDELLRQLLALILKPCETKNDLLFDGPNAPFSSFSAKIDILERMRLIPDDIHQSLHLIRKIRNEFAHRINNCEFDNNKKILQWNKKLDELNNIATKKKTSNVFSRPYK